MKVYWNTLNRRRGQTLAIVGAILCALGLSSPAKADGYAPRSSVTQRFGPTEKGLALSASLEKEVVHVGDPIQVTFAVKDDGPALGIFRIGTLEEYELHGTRPDGSSITRTDEQILFSGSIRSGWGIGPDSVYIHTTRSLGTYYDFARPGHYKFYFTSAVALELHLSELYAVLTSNTVE
jgi:hypothetical protein